MPADTLLWDEDACLDAIKVFVVAACKGAVVAARHVRQLRRMVPADRVADAWRLGVGKGRRGA